MQQTPNTYSQNKYCYQKIHPPDIFMLIKIADIFDVSLDELVGRK